MPLDTRGVLAIMSGMLMSAAFVVARTERRLLGTWLMTLGFVVATLWSGMSVFWARSNSSLLTSEAWLSLAAMAAAASVYFGYLGLDGEGLGR